MDLLLSHFIAFVIGCLTILYLFGYKIRPNLPPNLNIINNQSYLLKMIEIEIKKNENDIVLREQIINQLLKLIKQNPNAVLNKEIYASVKLKLNELFKLPISIQKNKIQELIQMCLNENKGKDFLNLFSNENILKDYLNISVDNFALLSFINLFFQKLFKNINYQNIWKISLKNKLTVITKNVFFKEILIDNVSFNSEIKFGKIFLFSENFLVKIDKISKQKNNCILKFNTVKNLNELEIMKLYNENLKVMHNHAPSSIVFYIKLPIMEFSLCLVCDFNINLKLTVSIIDLEGYICLNLNEFLNFDSKHSQKLRFSFFHNPKFNLKIKILNMEDSGESNNLTGLNWIISSLSKTIKYLLVRNVIFPRFNYIPLFVTRLASKVERPNLIKFIENLDEKVFTFLKPMGVWLWDEKTHYLMCNQKSINLIQKSLKVSVNKARSTKSSPRIQKDRPSCSLGTIDTKKLFENQELFDFLFKEFKHRLSETPEFFLTENKELIDFMAESTIYEQKNVCPLSSDVIEFIPLLKYKHIHEFENISNYCLCFVEREYVPETLVAVSAFNKSSSVKKMDISCENIIVQIRKDNATLNINGNQRHNIMQHEETIPERNKINLMPVCTTSSTDIDKVTITGPIRYLKNKAPLQNAYIEILEIPLTCKEISLFHLSLHLLMKLIPSACLTIINRIRNHLIVYLNIERRMGEDLIKNKLENEFMQSDRKTAIISYKQETITIFLDDTLLVFKIKQEIEKDIQKNLGQEFIFDDFLEKLDEDLKREEDSEATLMEINEMNENINFTENMYKEEVNELNKINGIIKLKIFMHSKNFSFKKSINEILNSFIKKPIEIKDSSYFPPSIMKYIQKGLIFDHNTLPLKFSKIEKSDINSLSEIMIPEILVCFLNKTVIGIKRGRSLAYEINRIDLLEKKVIIQSEMKFFTTIYLINDRLFVYESSFNEKYGKVYISVSENNQDLCIFHILPLNILPVKINNEIKGLEKSKIINFEGVFEIRVYSKILDSTKILQEPLKKYNLKEIFDNTLDLNLALQYKRFFYGLTVNKYLNKTRLRVEKGSFGFKFYSPSKNEYILNINSSLGIDLLLDYDILLGESYFIFYLPKASIITLELKPKNKQTLINDISFVFTEISKTKEFIVFDCEKFINRYFLLEKRLEFKAPSIFFWESALDTKISVDTFLEKRDERQERGNFFIEKGKVNIRFRNLEGVNKNGRIRVVGVPKERI